MKKKKEWKLSCYNLGHQISTVFTISVGFHDKQNWKKLLYITHNPIDFSIYFSYRLKTKVLDHMVIGLKQVRVSIGI